MRQVVWQQVQLSVAQLRRGTGMRFGAQCLATLLPHGFEPLAHGRFTHAQGFGDQALFPMCAFEFQGTPAACLLPIMCLCHALSVTWPENLSK
jgi:hypothetical protein